MSGASFFHEDGAVGVHRLADWDLEGGPEAIVASGGLGIGRADDDMTTEGIVLEHEVEGVGELIFADLPGDESAFGEVAGDEGLTNAANRAGGEHRLNAGENRIEGNSAESGNFCEGFADESLNFVFGDGEDLGVDRVGMFDGHEIEVKI